ncbi:MAG TPA: PAS domain S-box protein [Methylovirgula sp.]
MESEAHLLVVDRDAGSREEKLRLLEKEGWKADAADSDAAALKNFDLGAFDVVVVDSNAWDKGGPSLCKTIEENYPETSILHTSRGGDDLYTHSEEVIAGYLLEPFNGIELITLVRSLLNLRRTKTALQETEARLKLAQDAGGLAVFDWNLLTGRAIWSDRFAELFELPDAARDMPFNSDVIRDRLHPDDRAGLQDYFRAFVADGGVFDRDFRIVSSDGITRWITARGKFIKGPSGRLERIFCLSLDMTDRKESDLRNAQLAEIVASSIDAIFSIDFSDTILTWNNGAERLFGYTAQEALGRKADFLVPDKVLSERRANMQRLLAGEAIEYQTRGLHKDGQSIDVWIRGAPVRGLDGNFVGGSLIVRDITAQTQREAHVRFLMRELTHRSKNLLAVIQAMARQSLILQTTPEDFVERFSERLSGLAGSHDLLSSDDWAGASLVQLIRSQLQHYGDLFGTRIQLQGPDLILRPEAAQNIGIALHELSTNAAKFGALSVPEGKVTISWKFTTGANDARRMHMNWEEKDGPPVVPPDHRGFGHMVMDKITGQALGGRSQAQFAPEGVSWTLDVPATSVLREAAA